MRIIGQCDENEAREIFEAHCDKSDIWVVKSEGSCTGMVSYTVFGLIIGESNNRLFAVEERFVDGKGSKDCANRVCLHAVRKYLAQYGCKHDTGRRRPCRADARETQFGDNRITRQPKGRES